MTNQQTPRLLAERYHSALPDEIRRHLNGRGISDEQIDAKLLGWSGSRISIPVFGREGQVLFLRYAKAPADHSDSPKVMTPPLAPVELYGWEQLAKKPYRVVICEGEYDRLVLEAHRFAAVTSTAGAQTFRPEWARYFDDIRHVYICFDRDEAGEKAARKVQAILPRAVIVRLPDEVGPSGDISDFFVRLGKTRDDFERLIGRAIFDDEEDRELAAERASEPENPPARHAYRATRIKAILPLQRIAARYTELLPSGPRLVGLCPFHEDAVPSFTVYPDTNTYYCFGCGVHGDVITLIEEKESKTFAEALDYLERLAGLND